MKDGIISSPLTPCLMPVHLFTVKYRSHTILYIAHSIFSQCDNVTPRGHYPPPRVMSSTSPGPAWSGNTDARWYGPVQLARQQKLMCNDSAFLIYTSTHILNSSLSLSTVLNTNIILNHVNNDHSMHRIMLFYINHHLLQYLAEAHGKAFWMSPAPDSTVSLNSALPDLYNT